MIAKHIRSILVLGLAATVPLTPTFAVAQSPRAEASAPIRVYIETDEKALGDRGNGMQGALVRELRAAFEAGGVELLDPEEMDPDAVRLRIRFSGKAEDVYLFNYELHFELIEGKTATQLIEPVMCSECFDPALYEALNHQVPALIEALEAEAASHAEGNDVTPPTGDGDAGDGDGDSTDLPKAIGPLGFAGVGVTVVGVGVTIGGAVEWSRGRVYEQSAGYYRATGKDHGPLGYALVGVGAAATVAGLVMLGVDAGRRAKLRKQARSHVLVIPSISPSNAGIGIIGRF
ncbi:MAG TPA: hypothetical protein VK034_20095 [Enhygromyxa sp.]|nr:hypothetical protein [Enhygromyxa sp.]